MGATKIVFVPDDVEDAPAIGELRLIGNNPKKRRERLVWEYKPVKGIAVSEALSGGITFTLMMQSIGLAPAVVLN